MEGSRCDLWRFYMIISRGFSNFISLATEGFHLKRIPSFLNLYLTKRLFFGGQNQVFFFFFFVKLLFSRSQTHYIIKKDSVIFNPNLIFVNLKSFICVCTVQIYKEQLEKIICIFHIWWQKPRREGWLDRHEEEFPVRLSELSSF